MVKSNEMQDNNRMNTCVCVRECIPPNTIRSEAEMCRYQKLYKSKIEQGVIYMSSGWLLPFSRKLQHI